MVGGRPARAASRRSCAARGRFPRDGVPRHDPASEAEPLPPPTRVRELAERRTANSRTFQLQDGRVEQEISAGPLNFRDGAGQWQPIDPTVRASSRPGFSLANETNGYRSYYGDNPDALVRFETAAGAITLATPGRPPGTPVAERNTVTYASGLGPGLGLSYQVTPEALKESIVVEAPPEGDGHLAVDFALGLEGPAARQQRDDGHPSCSSGRRAPRGPGGE